jgi:hypothetical protein
MRNRSWSLKPAHYLVVANAHAKSGDSQAGLEILSKCRCDPQNTTVRLKLAEVTCKRMTAGGGCFHRVDTALRVAPRQALDAFEIARHPAGDTPTLNGLLCAAAGAPPIDGRNHRPGLEQRARQHRTAFATVNAYIQAEDPQRAEAATGDLVSKDSSPICDSSKLRLYVSSDDIDAAVA